MLADRDKRGFHASTGVSHDRRMPFNAEHLFHLAESAAGTFSKRAHQLLQARRQKAWFLPARSGPVKRAFSLSRRARGDTRNIKTTKKNPAEAGFQYCAE